MAVTFDPAAIDIALRPVGSGFDNPILVTNAGDGSGRLNITSFGESEGGELFVAAQNGDIRQLIELTRYPGSGSR